MHVNNINEPQLKTKIKRKQLVKPKKTKTETHVQNVPLKLGRS